MNSLVIYLKEDSQHSEKDLSIMLNDYFKDKKVDWMTYVKEMMDNRNLLVFDNTKVRLAVELLQNKLSSEAVSNVYEIDSNDSVENDEAILKELAKILSEMPLCEKIVVESVFI